VQLPTELLPQITPVNGLKHNAEMLTKNKTLYIHQPNIDVYKAMATDEYLLQCVSDEQFTAAIHVYSWNHPCITLGRFTPSDVLKENCDIPVTRRITGGNALYHENDIAYSVVIKLDENKNIGLELCKKISEIIQTIFSDFQINTKLILNERNLNNRRLPCNETFSRCELIFNNKKIAASAQKNNRLAILQQGSIYLNHQPQEINKYLNQANGIVNAIDKLDIDKSIFMQKLGKKISESFDMNPAATLSCEQEKIINNLIYQKYRTYEWIWQNSK
jgi:lipoate-protein ligase A